MILIQCETHPTMKRPIQAPGCFLCGNTETNIVGKDRLFQFHTTIPNTNQKVYIHSKRQWARYMTQHGLTDNFDAHDQMDSHRKRHNGYRQAKTRAHIQQVSGEALREAHQRGWRTR